MRYFTYFNYIKFYFGLRGTRILNDFINLNITITNCIIRIKFLKTCIKYGLTPIHLIGIKQFRHVNFFHKNSVRKFNNINKKYIELLLKLKLSDAYNKLRYSRSKLFVAYNNINNFFPLHIANNFFNVHNTQEYKRMYKENKKIDRKIRSLMQKDLDNRLHNIKPITYNITSENNIMVNVSISPKNFSVEQPLDTVQNNWFVNLSEVEIPLEVQGLLQLGDRFGLPPFEHQKKRNIINFIKNVENNINNFKLNEEVNLNIRSLSVSSINKLFNEFSLSHNDKILLSMYNSTRTFLKKTS